MMATAHGPCRFGQYAPYLRRTLDEMGYQDVMIFSPTSENGYEGFGEQSRELLRTAWMGLIAGDIATKFLLKTRPYERSSGDADAAFQRSVVEFESILERPGLSAAERLRRMTAQVEAVRDRFRAIPADYVRGRPLIGLVGEIFCRLNTFSNQDVARTVERLGGECWLSDIAEWVWYTNWYQEGKWTRERGKLNAGFLKMKIKTYVQRRDEHALYAPIREDFRGYEEPDGVGEVLERSRPYLPSSGCLGEMVLSVGKALYLHGKGADGILDISPFTCMNGIICEAIYPVVSADHDRLPIRVCYFDGVSAGIERDLEIFLELARGYQKRKHIPRIYPRCFD